MMSLQASAARAPRPHVFFAGSGRVRLRFLRVERDRFAVRGDCARIHELFRRIELRPRS